MVINLKLEESDSNELTEADEEVEQQNPSLRRFGRVRKELESYTPPNFQSTFVLYTIGDEPKSVGKEINSIDSKLCPKSMKEKMDYFHKNETWYLFKLPDGRKHVDCKWMLMQNLNATNQSRRYKAQLAVKGYSQIEKVDLCEIFSLVSN